MSSAEATQSTVFPDLCRSCNERVRIDGWFKCPDCESDVDPVTGSFSLVRKETYDDYPDAAVENARMALEAREDTGNPNDCGTRVGWERANQLDNRENLSVDTISRMAAFARHEDNYDPEADRSDCGWLMWKAWGGKEGVEWAEDKLDEIEKSLKSHSTWLINDNQLVRKSDGRVCRGVHPPSPDIELQKQEAVNSGSSVDDNDEVEIEGYPNLPPEDARPELVELLKAIDEDEEFDPLEMPVLFELLQDSAPSYKMPKYAVDYTEDDAGEQVCANCEYAYRGMDGRMICSQVRGEIKGEAWCNLFELETRRTEKRRVYVNSPEEVPDEYEPQQGDAGGIYYETEQSVEEERDMDIEELGEALSDVVGQERAQEIFSEVSSPKAAYDYYDAVSEGLEVNPLDPDEVEIGDQVWSSDYGTLTVENVEGNPAIALGPEAGYVELENGVYANLMGDVPSDVEGQVDEDDVVRIADLQSVEQQETLDRNAFDVESEVDYDSSEVVDVSNGSGTARTLPSEERDQFWDKLEEVHSSAHDLKNTMMKAKKSSYSNQGQFREKAFLKAAGLRGDLDIRNDTLASSEPSDEFVAVADKVREASQTAFEKEFGESKEVHRGLSGIAMQSIVSQAIEEETDDVEFETFGMTNFSTADGVADKFANVKRSVTVSKEITADDVLLWSDYFLRANQEGEISIKSDKLEVTLEDLELPWTGRTLDEELTDPSDHFISIMEEKGITVPEGGVDL